MEMSGSSLYNLHWYGEYDLCKKISTRQEVNGTMRQLDGSYTVITYLGPRRGMLNTDYFKTAFCATPSCKKFMEISKDCTISIFQ